MGWVFGVPDKSDFSARPEQTVAAKPKGVAVKPVEGLCRTDKVHRMVGQRNLFCCRLGGNKLGTMQLFFGCTEHLGVGLDAVDKKAAVQKQLRKDAGAASSVDCFVSRQLQLPQDGRDRLGIMGAAGPVIAGLFGKSWAASAMKIPPFDGDGFSISPKEEGNKSDQQRTFPRGAEVDDLGDHTFQHRVHHREVHRL